MRIASFILAIAAIVALLAQSSSSYRITHTYLLGGDGSWDYLVPDPAASPVIYCTSESRHGSR